METEAPKSPAKHYRERGILAYGERMGPKQADENGRAVGVRRTPVMRIDPSREIHPALKKKASRYCKLDYPYLVALNALSTYHNELALIDANRISAQELEGRREEFARLNHETSRSVLDLYQSRKSAAAVETDKRRLPQLHGAG